MKPSVISMRIALAAGALALAACQTPAAPASAAGDYLAGRLAAGLNDIDAAAEHYAAAVAANPADDELLRNAFLFSLAAGRVEAAAPYAERLAAGEEKDELARYVLAAIKLKRGDLEGARKDLNTDYSEGFIKSIAFETSAWVEAEIAGPAAGMAAFDIGKDVFTGFNPTFKAMLAEKKGDIDKARALHQVSVQSFGGPIGRAAFGAFLERNGAKDEAREYYEILDREGGASRRLAQEAMARIKRGAPSREYLDVSARQGAALALYLFAGNVLQQSAEEMQKAADAGFKVSQKPFNLPLALAELSVYLDPHLGEAQRLIGSIHNAYGNYAAARAAFAKVPPSSPEYEQAEIEIANSFGGDGDTARAIETLKSAIRSDPGANEARLMLAGYYAEAGRHEDAVKAATAAINALGPTPPEDSWRLYVTRASSLIELDRFNDAESDLERAVEVAPEEPIALNYLGYSWIERGLNLDKAFALIEKAVALRPQSGAIIDSLGWAHYQRGDYEEALPHLEKAASLEAGDPTVTEHLGDVYWRLGRKTEARFQWERALELSPTDKARAGLEQRLKSGLGAPEQTPEQAPEQAPEPAPAPAPPKQ